VEVRPVALSGIYDSRLCDSLTPYHLYMFVYLCRPHVPGQRPRVSNETVDVGWFDQPQMAALEIDPGHIRRIADAFGRWRGEIREAVFDAVKPDNG